MWDYVLRYPALAFWTTGWQEEMVEKVREYGNGAVGPESLMLHSSLLKINSIHNFGLRGHLSYRLFYLQNTTNRTQQSAWNYLSIHSMCILLCKMRTHWMFFVPDALVATNPGIHALVHELLALPKRDQVEPTDF